MTEDVKQEEHKVQPNDPEMAEAALESVGHSELDENGKPKVKPLTIEKIQKDIPNYRWIDIFKDDPSRLSSVKVYIGDPFILREVLGEDDVLYAYQNDTAERDFSNMSPEELMSNDDYDNRYQNAIICTFILEPKFCLEIEGVDGAMPVASISLDLKAELLKAYAEGNKPKEALD